MPYIKDVNRRCDLAANVAVPRDSGELSYTLATIIDEYLALRGIDFDRLNGIIGVLNTLESEIQRRFVDPYEDVKRVENGEVFLSLIDNP